MASRNISDIIEDYLKDMLGDNDQERVEIRRSDIANHFDVVPSQINYVIKTRFTLRNGYLVESKRGGGGYIRIEKINLMDNSDVLDSLIDSIGDEISEKDEESILTTLYANGVITEKEKNMIAAILKKEAISLPDQTMEYQVRASVLEALLYRLKYEC
ncbi:CtsR family transcriptional regulator [Fructilactobacillus fructivorans]|uniref:Transcriptional regulator CtsR n=1 Tax=Fructilactobacillus fructivorans TaxID=1614 RepID=A0A0C1PN96_9LACO|nr:CtsR family transcriptional regulator [Fructilactobacillus fructivorans]KID41406.1 Transcriptional regulator CtsR [Fructilactobacillus fructivorans]KRK57126.1 transcriptional regulator CtsR [Fructilactobacillus fructivorans]KRN40369.1 transcriptional regulator CtsR [Fructilactobacillus fructivorans]KRN42635.1 transcriptional regulator CtsR [Fructilactobacillus fructivorans]MCT0151706.1 CtsR family transcriptional regulator [Fructilactobacillus fructivorans]